MEALCAATSASADCLGVGNERLGNFFAAFDMSFLWRRFFFPSIRVKAQYCYYCIASDIM